MHTWARSLTASLPFLLSIKFPHSQLLRFPLRRTSIPHFLVEDERLRWTRPLPFPDFPLAMKIRAADVESVDVARDDAAEEEDAVEEGIGVGSGQEEDGEWREENCDECQH